MKKILVAFVIFILIGCVATEPVDYSLTDSEKDLCRNILASQYPIDSFKVDVQRWLFGNCDWGKYDYALWVYTPMSKADINIKVLHEKADSLAYLMVETIKKQKMQLAYFHFCLELKDENALFSYKIDEENRPTLVNNSSWTR